MAPPRRPDPAPLEADDVLVLRVGMGLFAVLFVVLLVLRGTLAAHDVQWWLAVPPLGIVLGLLGERFCRRRLAAIARDAAHGIPQRD